MKLFKDCWVALLEIFNAISGTTLDETQQSLEFGILRHAHGRNPHNSFPPKTLDLPTPTHDSPLIFEPPSHGEVPQGREKFVCNYTAMGEGWSSCSTSSNRGCWLKGPNGEGYNISTDYEHRKPTGITRRYVLNVTSQTINADGVDMKYGKVFNESYPGPWIQACWGDAVEITVINNLRYNGTTVHWHGIRMLNSTEHDGVNAVTQCPIAPGDNFTYKFDTWQYGSTWYHSHYSLQYGDGMLGPLTIHGPASANYDEPVDPILMSDWNHDSGFMHFQTELMGHIPKMDSILLNGKGSYAAIGDGGEKYKLSFKYGKKYLLRLINTSVDTTFVFAIDNHRLMVISADLVPIVNYTVDHIVIGIGQRYHVIVEAKPNDRDEKTAMSDWNKPYWIRTIPATDCFHFMTGGTPDERQGILTYHNDSIISSHNDSLIPRTERGSFNISCRDELYHSLVPYLPWNIPLDSGYKESIEKPFRVGADNPAFPHGRPEPNDNFTRWAMGEVPMYLNFSDPTINNLNNSNFTAEKVVVLEGKTDESWVYMILTAKIKTEEEKRVSRKFYPGAHPMHLHGHDFALLQQSNETWESSKFKPKLDNPPRRDVVLLPQSGFIVIAFKTDNPGAWAFHCHIAWHASSGLVIQVLERQSDLLAQLEANPGRLDETHRVCSNWNTWYSDKNNFWDPHGGKKHFQDDSGV